MTPKKPCPYCVGKTNADRIAAEGAILAAIEADIAGDLDGFRVLMDEHTTYEFHMALGVIKYLLELTSALTGRDPHALVRQYRERINAAQAAV